MNFSQQLKKYRLSEGFSQEELAERIYVTRQTISKWENDKTYPDIHNLIALSILFDITLDELIKGDVKMMKENVELNEMNKYSKLMVATLLLMALLVGPCLFMFSWYGLIVPLMFWLVAMFAAFKIEKIKKEQNIETYAEILAYTEGRDVEVERAKRDKKKDAWNKFLLVLFVALASGVIAGISAWLSLLF